MNKREKIIEIVNKIRYSQGWSSMDEKEASKVAGFWEYHLDRHGVHPELYDIILNKAIDYRIMISKSKDKVPPMSLELFIQIYDSYKEAMFSKLNSLKLVLQQVNYSIYSVENKLETLQEALSKINPISLSYGQGEMVTLKDCKRFSQWLEKKIETFLQDNYLGGNEDEIH